MSAAPFWRTLRARFDWTLTSVTVVILSFGMLNLWSAIREREPGLLSRQLMWLGIGTVLFIGAACFDYRRLARLGFVVYGIGVSVLVYVLAAGRSAGGAKRWIALGPLVIQPSEVMKTLLVIALAKHIQDAPSVTERTVRHLLVPVLLAAVPVLLIAAQPDLDTALVLALVFATIMLTARLSLKTWGGIVVAGLIALAPLWQYGLRDYQKNRIQTFINPAADAAGAWQPTQAMNAVGSGRLFGKGYLQATQVRARTLPALWTDYPFAIWCEEWGFFGGLAMIVAFGVLIFWILKVSREARDRFGAILCVGCAAMLFWQLLFNMGMATGLFPVAGITLPLISYGGSSLLTFMLSLGLVLNVSLRRFSYDGGTAPLRS